MPIAKEFPAVEAFIHRYEGLTRELPFVVVLLRILQRLRLAGNLVAGVALSLPMRGLNSMLAEHANPYLLVLRATKLLREVDRLIDAIEATAQRSLIEPVLFSSVKHAMIAHWISVADLVCKRESELIAQIIDAKDMFARIAEFYLERGASTPGTQIGALVKEYYSGVIRDDVVAPREQQMELPLREMLCDLISLLNRRNGHPQTIMDYGSGLGRSRHYFYSLARQSREQVGETPEFNPIAKETKYLCVDVAQSLPHLRRPDSEFPNGNHFHDCDRQRLHITECPYCFACSALDELLLIDPQRPTIVSAAFNLGGQRKAAPWQASRRMTLPDRVDAVLLVNVLHEVPLSDLPVLLANLDIVTDVGTPVFVYEMLGPASIEEFYTVWTAEDMSAVFQEFGYRVIALPGRIRNPSRGTWGFPYLLAHLLKVDHQRRAASEIAPKLLAAWEAGIPMLVNRIERLRRLLQSGRGLGTHKFEHLHAMHSLVNSERQLQLLHQSRNS
ncbi:MAG: hypothetical protein WBX25_13570 [Rhodomicrobium sp.]